MMSLPMNQRKAPAMCQSLNSMHPKMANGKTKENAYHIESRPRILFEDIFEEQELSLLLWLKADGHSEALSCIN